MSDIPLIDLSSCTPGNDAERQAIAEIDRACRDVGFFTVCGHGLERAVVEDAHTALKQFFARPLEEKMKCRLESGFTMSADEYTPYGYSALLEENAFAYMGEVGKPSDYVEKFSAGRLILNDDEPLPFPDDEQGRVLRQKLRSYYLACENLAARVSELLSVALDLPRDFFASRSNKADDSMRGHIYPNFSTALANDQGMGQHTDGSLISLLTQTGPGIQVRTRDGEWITPSFRSLDHFIVNIGDLLAYWTSNQYVSTPHRAVLSEHERQSIVFFKLTNEDEMVRAGNKQMDALFGRTSAN